MIFSLFILFFGLAAFNVMLARAVLHRPAYGLYGVDLFGTGGFSVILSIFGRISDFYSRNGMNQFLLAVSISGIIVGGHHSVQPNNQIGLIDNSSASILIAGLILLFSVTIAYFQSELRSIRSETYNTFIDLTDLLHRLSDILPDLSDEYFHDVRREDILLGFSEIKPNSIGNYEMPQAMEMITAILPELPDIESLNYRETDFIVCALRIESLLGKRAVNEVRNMIYPALWIRKLSVVFGLIILAFFGLFVDFLQSSLAALCADLIFLIVFCFTITTLNDILSWLAQETRELNDQQYEDEL